MYLRVKTITNSMVTHPHGIQMTLAINLRKKRKAMNLTQEDFAKLCGLHRTYIGAIERGERNITLSTLASIASAIEVYPHDLLKGS